ncbi:MAG: FHA domain-containing protein, partial [Anaerolineaceae bacterium]|nr:FHA domain-containing protein [Anaerolineaceae bacterium]
MKIKSITLKYRREDGDWYEQELAPGTYVIGRSAQADLQFDSSNISRQHCQIEVAEDHVTIMDMGSSNGTYVDGERLASNNSVALEPEQTFKVGSFEASMVWVAAVEEAPLYEEVSTSRRLPEPLKGKIQEEEEASFKGYTLHLTNSQGESREVPLEPGQYVMGRTASADIQIEEEKISRLHARIHVTVEGCQIEDVGSSNGTKLNGEKLTPHKPIDFSLGQVVEIGGCSLSLQHSGAGVEALMMEDDATQIDGIEDAAETMVEPVGVENETLIEGGLIEDSTQLDAFEEDSTQLDRFEEESTQLDGLGADSTQLDAGIDGERTSIGEVPMQVDRTFLDGLTPVQQIEDASNGLILRFQRDQGAWDQITLRPGEYVLGRSEEADLSIPDTKISRRHAKIIVDAAMGCFLMDMGSANGTQINGNPLRQRVKVPFGMSQTASMGSYLFQVMPLTGESRTMIEVAQSDIGETLVSATQMAPVAALTLRYREGSGSWQELPLGTGEQIMGRSSEAQLRIPSNTMSRRHASLFIQEGRVWITDLSSKNGILINGQRISPEQSVELSMGQKFMVDDFVFEIIGGGMQIAGYDPTLISGDAAAVILEPGRMDALLNIPSSAGAGEHTMIGEEMGIDMALLGSQQAQAPINLAGHERVTIGRGTDNMISFEHPLVSRYHAVIERMGTRTRITDLHSSNGVYINGQKVETQSWLKQGDSIKIGPYLIGFTGNELRPSAEQSYNIDVVGLQKWVTKDINLLKELSLNVGQNEFVALVGMSGAGKSTLMDAINGFRPATHGAVYVNGTDLYDNYGQFRDEIGNVPQRDIVHMELTAEQALEYAAQLRMPADTTAAERQHAVSETLEDLGLTFRKDVQNSRLSGGQIKRVSIGVELLTKPRLFFLDEPTSGLDPGTEYEMMKLLRRLADQGRTIMIITHATKNVMFCDKAIILANRGNLAFYGPPEDGLTYFDQYRTHRERLEKEMEFDDIYRILEDPNRGKPEDWRDRYLQSEYAKYTLPKQSVAAPQAQPVAATKRKQGGKRISAFKQFFILSHRYLRCMFQDKASLILTLSLAPLLGLMNFIWGSKLFDPVNGNAAKTMGVWFAVTIMGILVGYMGSIQELVKEKEIYKRERAVGLKILPYIMS